MASVSSGLSDPEKASVQTLSKMATRAELGTDARQYLKITLVWLLPGITT